MQNHSKVASTIGLRTVMLIAVVGAILAPAASAWAATGDGPTPPAIGDPAQGTGSVSPHGGYGSSSNFCLQCHSVHNAGGDGYALLWKSSVQDTCNTCHAVFGTSPTGTKTGLLGTGTMGTASTRSAYTVTGASKKSEHTGTSVDGNTITEASWTYSGYPGTTNSSTAMDGGLNCASCHTPHADRGLAVNTKKLRSTDSTHVGTTAAVRDWAEGTGFWFMPLTGSSPLYRYLHHDTEDAAGVWQVCTATSPAPLTGLDTGCVYAQAKDTKNQVVSLYGYKLLSMYPNHTYSTPVSYKTDYRDRDQPNWCGACHTSRVDTAFGGTTHNHPTGCRYCHGNPANATSSDFPHTSTNESFLVNYPDLLCTSSCHSSSKSLP
ncbi:MAG: cytochrome c3 family protein [Actinomycetota bacterium]